jgi:hypothetical protein
LRRGAADRGGASVAAGLHAEGITLARVDAKGRAGVQANYQEQFEKARAAGRDDARLRRAPFKEGELVTVNKRGDVERLNPRFIDTEKLERAATGGTDKTPTLSDAREFFATAGQRQKDDRAAARASEWQDRPATKTEERILYAMESADKKEMPLAAGLHFDGLMLAKVDAAGIASVNKDYERQFENDKRLGVPDAWLRTTQMQEGELVVVHRTGTVERINPSFIDLAKLEHEATGGKTHSLSDAREFFATARQEDKADRTQKWDTIKEAGKTGRSNDHLANAFKSVPAQAASTAGDAALKVVSLGGVMSSLSGFLEDFLFSGTGDRPPPTSEEIAQQRAFAALEAIEESLDEGYTISASDVRNLLPTQLENLSGAASPSLSGISKGFFTIRPYTSPTSNNATGGTNGRRRKIYPRSHSYFRRRQERDLYPYCACVAQQKWRRLHGQDTRRYLDHRPLCHPSPEG